MITSDVKLGRRVKVWYPELVNFYGCEIGDNTKVASFVEIQAGVTIGRNCLIEAFAYICSGVTIEDNVFLGQHCVFLNDKYPPSGERWNTLVKKGASIGANSTIMCGITIGKNSRIGAGSVVTKDVPDGALVYGNPARVR